VDCKDCYVVFVIVELFMWFEIVDLFMWFVIVRFLMRFVIVVVYGFFHCRDVYVV